MGSTKNVLRSFQAFGTGATVSGSLGADVNGPATDISWLDNISVQINCGAGATGEFFIQGSNVPTHSALPGPASTDWVTIPLVDETGAALTLAVTGTATNFLCNLQRLAFTYLRVFYDFTSGTGTANAYVTGKAI